MTVTKLTLGLILSAYCELLNERNDWVVSLFEHM